MDPATTLFPPLPMFVLSPTTRRRNRGRGTVVFDNLTEDSQMNNGQTTGTTGQSDALTVVLGFASSDLFII